MTETTSGDKEKTNNPARCLLPSWQFNWPHAYGQPVGQADIRRENRDFQVVELIPDDRFDGGEHQCVQVAKNGQNTAYVARRLANYAGVREMDIGYCGLKDRHALTTQWFSIYYGKRPKWQPETLELEGVSVKRVAFSSRKLRRGDHSGNRFALKLVNIRGDKNEIEPRLAKIADAGVPNYFGEQRFGREGHNLNLAYQWFTGQKRIKVKHGARYLSAARSYLFNALLAERVSNGHWRSPVDGDRVVGGELQFSLFGEGEPLESSTSLAYSQDIQQTHTDLANGLVVNRIGLAYRAAVCKVKSLQWKWENDSLWINFDLDSGSYATSVLREIANIRDVALQRQERV
ncbi:MAG: tRNA pseudouridine(13) synthase TruD [Gammaproteobacteria bacterium]|nr:MAG: tRNA pseudouridine(13) synthase TruD [Gammaproteobacteria bacterium]